MSALKTNCKKRIKERLSYDDWQDHDFVFTTGKGTPLRGGNVAKQSFKPLLQRAGLRDIRFHDLRHTAATSLLAQGVEPRVIQETLGHSCVGTILDIYSQVLPSLQIEAAGEMDAIF